MTGVYIQVVHCTIC